MSCLILLCLSISACRGTETASGTADNEINNFSELALALKDLDYGSVPSLRATDFSFPTPSAKNSSNGCAVTVSIDE